MKLTSAVLHEAAEVIDTKFLIAHVAFYYIVESGEKGVFRRIFYWDVISRIEITLTQSIARLQQIVEDQMKFFPIERFCQVSIDPVIKALEPGRVIRLAVSITTGIWLECSSALIFLHNSNPSMMGIMTSERTISGTLPMAFSRPSCPSVANSILNLSFRHDTV